MDISSHLNNVCVPQPGDKVYKDECVVTFDTPESPTGLYICLKTFLSFGRDYVNLYYQKTGHSVFLHISRTKKKIPESDEDGPEKKITKLAIGTPGGFMPDKKKYTYDDKYKIVILPHFTEIPYPNNELPEIVKLSVQGILDFESAFKQEEKKNLANTWDGEAVSVSKHATNLLQLNNGKKIPPSGWKCEFSRGCDMTTNLWLNLTDGSILCGRKYYDGTGGNNHAIDHYLETKYPLAVKLGTITKEGKADVYSYDEDEMVEDPHLIAHLAHWGINITHMEKTEKSMVELELDLNQKFGEWVALQEAGSKLSPVYGPGYTGLTNLGSSCYLNSVMQMIFTIPDFIKRFVEKRNEILDQGIKNAPTNFNVQMSKLGYGLLSGKYSLAPVPGEEDDVQGIAPRMFKILMGQGHPNFASNRQQDAQEFFLHFINILERNSRHEDNPADCFKFKVEERYQCNASKKVKYTYRPDYLLPLPIPLDMMTNKEEVENYKRKKAEAEAKKEKFDEDIVRPRIKLESCLEAFIRTEIVEQFYSAALNDKTTANKTTRLATFPDYLLIHLKKFTMNPDWSSAKLDVAIEMPDIIDLSMLRGKGLQSNEELLPDIGKSGAPPPVYDEVILKQLQEMGFPLEGCKRALYFTQNQSIEAATNWIMEHLADNDFWDQTFVPPGTEPKQSVEKCSFVPNEESIETLKSMGFTREQSVKALQATENNLERAADWIFSHQAEIDDQIEVPQSLEDTYRNGGNNYKLVGIISHMGTSAMVGHYVCHLLKNDKWIIFNDEKVAYSENPPKEMGYVYLYQRLDN